MPPRYGNHNSANVSLCNGQMPECRNGHYEYYQSLIKRHMNDRVEKHVEEFERLSNRFTPAGGLMLENDGCISREFAKQWLRTTLTAVAEEAYDRGAAEATTVANEVIQKAKEEARREALKDIVEWAKVHDMPDFTDNEERHNGYQDALYMLVAHLDSLTK